MECNEPHLTQNQFTNTMIYDCIQMYSITNNNHTILH